MKMITLNILKYFYANLTRVLEGKADVSKIGAINGIASLDANGKVPVAQIPTSGQGDKYRLIESESEGYAKVYKLQIKTSEASDYEDVPGATVNIPKDMVVESGSVKTCTEAGKPVESYEVGDKYIDLVIANSDDEHIYILVSDLVNNAADGISYDNTESELEADNVQEAIDEIVETKADKTEILPTYTLAEYEEIKDSIPMGTKFAISDDEGGDTPSPSGGLVEWFVIDDTHAINVENPTNTYLSATGSYFYTGSYLRIYTICGCYLSEEDNSFSIYSLKYDTGNDITLRWKYSFNGIVSDYKFLIGFLKSDVEKYNIRQVTL